MCRIIALRASVPINPAPWLIAFADKCRVSKEFQGDGWGVSWWTGTAWERYRSIAPIWDDTAPDLPAATVFIAHARSAFRDDEVAVEHNMPFLSSGIAFAFNGELRGVRLRVPGANGAARLFNLFGRFQNSSSKGGLAALRRLDTLVAERSEYVRALNLVVSDGREVWINTRFSEDPDYFTLYQGIAQPPSGATPTNIEDQVSLDGVVNHPAAHTVEVVSSERVALPDFDLQWTAIPNRQTVAMGQAE